MEKWHITDLDNNTLFLSTKIHDVAKFELELSDKGIPYKTRMYYNNRPVSKRHEKVTGNMISYKDI